MALTTRSYTAKSDVYSFGIVVWEIYSSGQTPYGELMAGEVVAAVRAGHRLRRPTATADENIVALIRSCTQMDVVGRPSMTQLRQRLAELCREQVAGTPGGGCSTPVVLGLSSNRGFLAAGDDEEESSL